MKTMLLRLTLILMVSLCLPAWADDQARLNEVKAEIKKLQNWLSAAREEQDELQQKLRKSDQDIAALLKEIEQTRARLREEQTRLKKLQTEQAQVRQLRNRHQTLLRQQLREAHQLGNEAALRFWLTQDDPTQNQRMTRYFGYFNRARLKNLTNTITELQRLDNLEVLIAEQQRTLQKTDARLSRENDTLASRRRDQQVLLAKLDRQVTSESQRLKQREADRKRLESLLTEVETLVSNSPRQNDEVPFKQMRGKLPRPLAGPVLAAFGNRNGPNARWEGWKIGAREGANITAVHHGRVVFSEWLRGFGLLLILDHGDGYLSLYAHNETLLRDVGSWVNGGELIATAGKSGGQQRVALYFEIRHKGRPQDPAAWLRRG